MSHNDNDSSSAPMMMIGALLLITFFFTVLVKAMKQFFIELGQSFEAFGNMTGSFIFMLWNILQVVFLVSLIIAALVCAVYFTIKYYQMVKEGTELREWVNNSMNEFEARTQQGLEQLDRSLERKVQYLDERLTKALEKPEIAPPMDQVKAVSISDETNSDDVTNDKSAGNNDSQPDELTNQDGEQAGADTDEQDSPENESVTMSNPY